MPANDRQVGGAHYKKPIQHWDFVEANKIPYMEAQIIRYVLRHEEKGKRNDLEKARHYIDKLIELRYPSNEQLGAAPHTRLDASFDPFKK